MHKKTSLIIYHSKLNIEKTKNSKNSQNTTNSSSKFSFVGSKDSDNNNKIGLKIVRTKKDKPENNQMINQIIETCAEKLNNIN